MHFGEGTKKYLSLCANPRDSPGGKSEGEVQTPQSLRDLALVCR